MWISFAQKVEPVIVPDRTDSNITGLRTYRYAEGQVHPGDAREQSAYRKAMSLGLVNAEGYLTPADRSLMVGFDGE